MFAEHFAQRPVHQVRRGVVPHDLRAARLVDLQQQFILGGTRLRSLHEADLSPDARKLVDE